MNRNLIDSLVQHALTECEEWCGTPELKGERMNKRNPTDLTTRNARASVKRDAALLERIQRLEWQVRGIAATLRHLGIHRPTRAKRSS